MLSRVILRDFGTVNSPLCTGAPSKAGNISQSERSYYWQLRSDWLMFFRSRNGGGKIALGEGWFVLSFDRHTMHWCGEDRVKSELGKWFIWIVIRLIEGLWLTSSVHIMCRRRMMSECRKSSRLFRWLKAGNCTDFWLGPYTFIEF